MSSKELYKKIKVSPMPKGKWILLEAFIYIDDIGIMRTVPKGFITNGADIPRAFWSYQPPNDPHLLPAIIVHDYFCHRGRYEMADYLFFEILSKLNVGKVRVYVLSKAVKAYTKYIRKESRKYAT